MKIAYSSGHRPAANSHRRPSTATCRPSALPLPSSPCFVAPGTPLTPLCHRRRSSPSTTTPRKTKTTTTAATTTDSTSDTPPSTTTATSSRVFLRTVGPTALALLLCNMDRICLSVAMVPIARELGWQEGVQGLVQSAFLWGYLANQLLGGTLADKFGGKKVMAAGIVFFSLASTLLPAVAITPLTAALGVTLPAVLFVRFLVGFGEGVALPSMNNLIATRIPASRRATALGGAFMGFHTGNLVGLLISPWILHRFGWRALFYIFGVLGAPLLLMWTLVVPPPPPQSSTSPLTLTSPPSLENTETLSTSPPSVAAPEADFKSSSSAATGTSSDTTSNNADSSSKAVKKSTTTAVQVSFRDMLQNKAVWAIIIANFANHWGYFIYLNWMPTYFYKVLGMDLRASSLMSFLPWLVMAAGSSFSGLLSDALVRSGTLTPTATRKIIQSIAFLGPVVPLLLLAAGGLSAPQAVAAMTCALGITSLGQFVTNMSDVAPRHAGRLFGLCNTFGSMAGILGVSLAGLVVEKTGSFGLVFQITAVLNIVGTLAWNVFATAEKQFD